jgi:solute carrier family 25 2-oxodicarboxylate transporter 21
MAQQKQPFWHNLVAGGIAGVTEILIMYPLDVVKTRAQLHVGAGSSMLSTLVHMVKTEGLGMYRGIVPPILVEAPKRAVKFAANSAYQPLFTSKDGKLSRTGSVAAGVCAGITEAFVVVPFELVKIRLQAKENKGKYKSTWDCVMKIASEEGILAFTNGLESTLWRHALWNGGYFGMIPTVKAILPTPTTETTKQITNFTAGAIAGTFGTMLNTPADVVKSRIQNQPKNARKYNWALPAIRTVVHEEGVAALYKGFVPKVLRLGPGGGILLVVFDFVSGLLRGDRK